MKSDKLIIFFISSWLPSSDNPHLGNFVVKHARSISLFCNVFFINISFINSIKTKSVDIEFEENLCLYKVYLPKNKTFYRLFPLFKFFRLFIEYIKAFFYVRKNYGKVDVVHSNIIIPISIIAVFIKYFFRVPFVITEHWTGYLSKDPYKLSIFEKFFTKFVITEATCVTTVSNDLKMALRQLNKNKPINIVPNVVNDVFFNLSCSKPKGKFNFIHISTLDDSQKNVKGIIDAFAEVYKSDSTVHLTFIGEKSNKVIEQYAFSKLNNKNIIDFKYNLSHNEIADFLSESHVLVMFSNYESFSIVIAEALASGIPVIATNCGGLASDLDERYGIIIEPQNTIALKEAMFKIKHCYDSFDKNLLRNFALQFTYEAVGKQFFNIYKGITDNK
jgi:glycosyltransferase involved in cell wall biosynthesis